MNEATSSIARELAAPFHPDIVEWKAQAAKGNRALAVAYIDARAVMDRLDEVLGPANWQDAYTVLPDGNVVCRLSIRLDGEWVSKEDVGGESDQQDEGDKRKASFSDSLKRVAVKWGIGRYLYRLPAQWVDYDSQKKQLIGTPKLPSWAIPHAAPSRQQPRREPVPAHASPEQEAEIDALAVELDMDHVILGKWTQKWWKVDPMDLTRLMADEAIGKLQVELARRKAEAAKTQSEKQPAA